MSSGETGGGPFLSNLPSYVLVDFCRIMDGLSDLDWTDFASLVLCDQTLLRLAEKSERKTDWVMKRWVDRNGRISELVDLLKRLQLLRPLDVILGWLSKQRSPSPPLPHPAPAPPPPQPSTLPQFDPLPKQPEASPPPEPLVGADKEERPLPRPAPPPQHLKSDVRLERPLVVPHSKLMCWSYEEVHAGTKGFSPTLQVGEGGFGVVYRATLSRTDCAVKKLKQDCLQDWSVLKESFQTEVDKLTKFRHPNIVDLLGYCEGPECMCLIYSYMENRSLDDKLHEEGGALSWSQRVTVVEGAAKALQYLHRSPEQKPLIHGDVKSSNILLDHHLEAKLADFGLARFAWRSSPGRTAAQTASVGLTQTIRGTVAYLPDEYVRDGQLGTAVDVYSFGVVLLEVLTGRRALERDRTSGERYLKDLVDEVEDSGEDSLEAAWRKQLDHRLISEGPGEPAGCLEMMVPLACRCLNKNRRRRPSMEKVFDILQEIHSRVKGTSSSSSPHQLRLQPPSLPRPPRPLDSSVSSLSQRLSRLGPLEDTYHLSMSSTSSTSSSSSSSSSSSFCSLTRPDPLHSSSSLPPLSSASLPKFSSSSSFPTGSSSLAGPCETDESRGFSQYHLRSKIRSNGTRSTTHQRPPGPSASVFSQPSVPTEDQYNFPPEPSRSGVLTAGAAAGGPSPVGSLQSSVSAVINPSKQRFLQKKTWYEEGRIRTPELLSTDDDLYGGRSSEELRGPEESDELDYLQSEHS